MQTFQSWNIIFNIHIKIFKIKMSIFNQLIIFEFKLKIPYSNQKFEIQIMFWKIEITIFRDKYEISNSNTFLRNSNSRFQNWNIRFE
jgi:hypothetical protein